jgi:hypothetical protein
MGGRMVAQCARKTVLDLFYLYVTFTPTARNKPTVGFLTEKKKIKSKNTIENEMK